MVVPTLVELAWLALLAPLPGLVTLLGICVLVRAVVVVPCWLVLPSSALMATADGGPDDRVFDAAVGVAPCANVLSRRVSCLIRVPNRTTPRSLVWPNVLTNLLIRLTRSYRPVCSTTRLLR